MNATVNQPPQYTPDCDVLIIGGGPAGSTAAALIAERGHRVTLLEKAHHPRFHIGESLLPANLPLFDKLGIADQVKAIGMDKYGAEFVSPHHSHQQAFEFAGAMDKSMPMAYQVRRSDFDEILIRNASKKNAQVIEGCQARDVKFLPDNAGAIVKARNDDGSELEIKTRMVLDASGRDTFLGNRLKIKQKNKKHNSAAIYGHFSGAERNVGKAAGNITIFWFEHGWFWYIPLVDGTTSVGAVTWPYYLKKRGKKSLETFLQETIAMCTPLQARLQNAKLVSEIEATGNYSYECNRTHGENYLLLGDAFAFIDPVFSSGVMLAMQSGFEAADTVDACLKQPKTAHRALKKFDRLMRKGPRIFSWFVYRITNPVIRDMFMEPRNVFRAKEAVLSVLAGDIYGKTPIHLPLFLFKIIYYTAAVINLRRTMKFYFKRQRNIKVEEAIDTTVT
ncbi:MAG: NAD(P)/FAD-dependent oxidoreductase [Methylophilaceae bacterium]